MKTILSIFIIAIIIIDLGGCATYKTVPLNSENINKSLQVPPLHKLEQQVNQIKNPLIPKHALKKPLSISEIAEFAVLLNPQLNIERLNLGLIKANLEQAKLLPNPEISFNLSKPISGTLTNPYIAYGISPSFDLGSIIQRNAKIKTGQLELESKSIQLKWDEWQVYENAKLLALNFIVLSNKITLLKEIEHLKQEQFDVLYKFYKQGLVNKIEMLNAQDQLQRTKMEVQSNEKLLINAKNELYKFLGLTYDYKLCVDTNLKLKIPINLPKKTTLLDKVNNRLDLIAIKLAYESNEEKLKQLVFSQFMPISISFPFARDTSDVHTLGFGINISFPIFNHNQGTIKYTQISTEKIYNQYISRLRDAQIDIDKTMSNLKNIYQAYEVVSNNLERIENTQNIYKIAFEDGNVSLLSYYNIKENLIKEKLALLDLKQSFYNNLIALEVSCGQNLRIAD
ncbi:TolC family protein [Desulfurella sp.]|uniref:TolC family protein n=1 Tax=Desulfurella sp. TaxID=1962857 RepID=UPI003D0D9B8B